MNEVRNLDNKRVCDVSGDSKFAEIVRKDCITRICVGADGKLQITHERIRVTA